MIADALVDAVSHATSSVDEAILRLLREHGAQTLDYLGQVLPHVNWPMVFLAVDRLSRAGTVTIQRSQGRDYLISLTSAAPADGTDARDGAEPHEGAHDPNW